MVAIYNKQGAEIKTPRMNINIHISIQPQAITGIINTISEEIASNMKNTTRAWLTGAGAVFGLIGMAAGYLIGSLFSDSEEEKLEKAMSRELDQEKRASIFAEIEGRWQDICNEIAESIDIAIFRDKNIERALTKDVNKLLDDYKRELTQAKMLIE